MSSLNYINTIYCSAEDGIENNNRTISTIKNLINLLAKQELEYISIQNAEFEALFERFCPFKINDRVELIETPEINPKKNWGLIGSKHFLVKGAVATVKKRTSREGQFVFLLEFDDDSYKEFHTNKITPSETKGLYSFNEKVLKLHEEIK